MEFTRCFRCMEKTGAYPCPSCGYDPRNDRPKEYALQPGTILNGKYVVGAMLGQGGFGITYIGWDLVLENKVAIKEYFPSGQVGRSGTSGTLQWYSTPQAENARNSGMEMFLKEARKMSRVREIPQVVHIRDLFQQNDTAYIVMDFVEGETLMSRLKKTGPLNWNQARGIFLPTIRAMAQVHGEGLIHRDLSPDNLMLLPDGSVKILDLGAAKDLNVNSGASSMQVAKGGFSPLEQYTQRGGSGSWSDVYAMAATMYYSITGVLPPPVMDRMVDDQLQWDLEPLKTLPGPALEALKRAMILLPANRTQTMGEFLEQLEKVPRKPAPRPAPKPAPEKKTWSPLLPIVAAALALVLMGGWVLWPTRQAQRPQKETLQEAEGSAPAESRPVFPLSIQEQTISASAAHTVAIKQDGSAVVSGSNVSVGYIADWTNLVAISAGSANIAGLKADGTVVSIATYSDGRCDVPGWENIVAVSVGGYHTVGLKADGTVVAIGENDHGQCDVSDWKNIVAICAGYAHTVGLKADGTVVATQTDGNIDYGQCDVSDWRDIVAIGAGIHYTVGLKADGTVVAIGANNYGQCDVSDWKDIAAISVGGRHTVGLKADGTVISTEITRSDSYNWGQDKTSDWENIRVPGAASAKPGLISPLSAREQTIFAGSDITVAIDNYGSILHTGISYMAKLCREAETAWQDKNIAMIGAYSGGIIGVTTDGAVLVVSGRDSTGKYDITHWQDIVDVRTQLYHTVGLRTDGTVVAAGENRCGQCDVSQWEDIVAISSGMYHTVGLKADGTVVSTQVTSELFDSGQWDVSGWTDIVAISAGWYQTVGLKADGTVVATEITHLNGVTGMNVNQDFSDWTDIVAISSCDYLTIGLKADGTVLYTGGNTDAYDFDVSGWKDIVAVSSGGDHLVGLKANGTLLATGGNTFGACNTSDWGNIRIPKNGPRA